MARKKPQRGQHCNRAVILVRDLDDATLQAIRNAEIPHEARWLDRLMVDSLADWRLSDGH
jgi:hypothetical protein